MQGERLTKPQVLKLERALVKKPEDITARIRLLGYYLFARYSSPENAKAKTRHILWMITHHPDASIANTPFMELNAYIDEPGYSQAVRLWQQQVTKFPTNTQVLGNAANFLLLNDPKTAKNLLQKASALEPHNPEWLTRLGELDLLSVHTSSGAERVRNAQEALNFYEKALPLLKGPLGLASRVLPYAAEAAFEARQDEKARRYATQLLDTVAQHPREEVADELHHGNLILGRLALRTGNIIEAKSYLLKAGGVPSSGPLRSFGPNMQLAKELLEKGEKQTVLQYFDECAKFWDKNQLQAWKSQVEQGQIPNFGANLDY